MTTSKVSLAGALLILAQKGFPWQAFLNLQSLVQNYSRVNRCALDNMSKVAKEHKEGHRKRKLHLDKTTRHRKAMREQLDAIKIKAHAHTTHTFSRIS